MRHFIGTGQFETDELVGLIDLADRLKFERANSISHPHLRGKTLGIFSRPGSSAVLHAILHAAMYELGGCAIDVPAQDLPPGRLTEIAAEEASCVFSGLAFGMYTTAELEALSKISRVPLINCENADSAPILILSELMSVRERTGSFGGTRLCIIDRDCREYDALIYTAISCGARVSVSAPLGRRPNESVADFGLRSGRLEITSDPLKAAQNADIIITGTGRPTDDGADTGGRDYRVTGSVLEAAHKNCMLMHSDPANRADGASGDILKAHREDMLTCAENRLHVTKAILVKTLKQQ